MFTIMKLTRVQLDPSFMFCGTTVSWSSFGYRVQPVRVIVSLGFGFRWSAAASAASKTLLYLLFITHHHHTTMPFLSMLPRTKCLRRHFFQGTQYFPILFKLAGIIYVATKITRPFSSSDACHVCRHMYLALLPSGLHNVFTSDGCQISTCSYRSSLERNLGSRAKKIMASPISS